MCGIFGIIGNNISQNNLDIKKLKMSLSHRGPDFNDHKFIDQIFFLHTRLSIIDLDKRANQPFFQTIEKK